eukprot:5641960-Pyramimonas_sp.AAC.1
MESCVSQVSASRLAMVAILFLPRSSIFRFVSVDRPSTCVVANQLTVVMVRPGLLSVSLFGVRAIRCTE